MKERKEDIMAEALISGAAALLVCLVTNYFSNRKTQALIEYRLNELTAKVDKHNSVIERTYALEKATAILQEDQSVANHRIADLEQIQKGAK